MRRRKAEDEKIENKYRTYSDIKNHMLYQGTEITSQL